MTTTDKATQKQEVEDFRDELQLQLENVKSTEDYEISGELEQAVFNELIGGFNSFEADSPLQVELRVSTMTDGYFVSGHLNGELHVPCGRCAEDYPVSLDSDVRSAYLPRPQALGDDEEVELSQDDLELVYFDSEVLDLEAFVRESILLELPDYPRCQLQEDGQCPIHGFDPNEHLGPTDDDERIDPWFSQLKAIKEKQKNGKE